MTRVLLVSNVRPGDPGGRAEKFTSRSRDLQDHGIRTVFGTVPEPYVQTFLPSVLRLVKQGRAEDVDLVTSVSNPFHLQVIGYLVSQLLRVPWLVEFRDPMVTSPDRDPGTLVTRLANIVERLAVTQSDHVVWGDGIQVPDRYYSDRYPVDSDHVTKLPFHGFDPAVFDGLDPTEYDAFTITYAGSFYDGWIEPFEFLEGLSRYADGADPELRVQFYGDWNDDYQRAVREAGLDEFVETHEFVPHEEIVPVLKGSDVALYVGGVDPQNRYNVPSKIWDYVGARIPILAVVDPSFRVASLIEEYDLGIVADPHDPGEIRDAIRDLHIGRYEYDPDSSVFDRFIRERKLETYAGIVADVATDT